MKVGYGRQFGHPYDGLCQINLCLSCCFGMFFAIHEVIILLETACFKLHVRWIYGTTTKMEGERYVTIWRAGRILKHE